MNDAIEVVGYAGAALTLVAWGLSAPINMRTAAIGSNAIFLVYGLATQNWPLVVMDLALLPMNGFRLWQLTRPPKGGKATHPGAQHRKKIPPLLHVPRGDISHATERVLQ